VDDCPNKAALRISDARTATDGITFLHDASSILDKFRPETLGFNRKMEEEPPDSTLKSTIIIAAAYAVACAGISTPVGLRPYPGRADGIRAAIAFASSRSLALD